MADKVEYGLLARYKFLGGGGTAAMTKTSRAFKSLHKNAVLAQSGVRQAGQGLRTFTMFGIGAVAVVGTFVKKSAKFNQQMSVVKSITNVTGKSFDSLRNKALKLGASTSFTSKEAAEGMEHLSRAGFQAKEVIAAIGPTLRMAEADSMQLGSAAQIVSSSIRQFRLNAEDATKVTDILAYVSANSNTDVTGLGQAMKFAGASAKSAGQSFEHTVGAVGLLANIGIRGTLAGTALKNALLKLTKQTSSARKLFGGKAGLTNALTDTTGKMRALPVIINNVITRLGKIKNEADRAKMAFEIFGLRGKAAMDAFAAHKLKDQARLLEDIGKKAAGTASRMARQRLDNLAGDWTLFKSALDNVAISIGSMLEPELRKLFKGTGGLISSFQKVGQAVNMMNEGFSESAVAGKYGKTVAAIAFGIKESFAEVKSTVIKTFKAVGAAFKRMTGGSGLNAKKVTKLVAKFIMFATVLTPVAVGLAGIGIAGGAMFNVLGGGFKMMRALTSGWGIALLVLLHTLSGTKKKGESTFEHMARGVKKLTKLVYALTAPFRLLAKHLGTIPAILAAIGGYKLAKMGIGKAGAALAGSRSRVGRMFGGVLGAAGRQGMPVYVTNFGEMPAGMGGMPGGAGMMGGGAAAAGTARKAGFLSRMGYVGKGLGMSTMGLLGGGKLVTGGTAATAGAAGKTASLVAGAGTAAAALGMFAIALAPAIAGVREVGKAYDPAYQAKFREKHLGAYRAKQRVARKKQETEDQRRAKLGLGPQFKSLEFLKSETWAQRNKRNLIEGSGVNLKHAQGFRKAFSAARGGKSWEAKDIMHKYGLMKLTERMSGFSERDLKMLGLNKEIVTVLTAIQKASSGQLEFLSRGWGTTISIDGKTIAIASSKSTDSSKRRAGKKSGANRADLERGTR